MNKEVKFSELSELTMGKVDINMQKILDFLKEAFCIDGECVAMPEKNYTFHGPMMKLTDSKRGTFYVALIYEMNIKKISS